MTLAISDTFFNKIRTAEKRREISWLLDMTLSNSWWSTQVGVKHLAKYCPVFLRLIGLILNNIPIAIVLMAIYLFFMKQIALGIFTLFLIVPVIYGVPKLACKTMRFMARRNKMFFVDLYVSGILHIFVRRKKEVISYPTPLEDIFD
jgi:hypothetical protein